jgi:ribose 5-phosphate isomerase
MTQKTHRCPNEACRKLLLLGRVVVHAETDDVATAIAYLQRLKALKGVQRSGLFVSAAEMLHNTDKP